MKTTDSPKLKDGQDRYGGYRSPLESRNASVEMRRIFSERRKFGWWRRIWLALAESQMELGLPVSQLQIDGLRDALDDIDFDAAAAHEARLRHDVMAHVHTFGDRVPEAAGIIHLGATSQDVVCNADILIQHEALQLIATKIARVVDRLGAFASRHRGVPTLGFTHYQPAQPTTVGKRATLWAQDFAVGLQEVERLRDDLRLRGMRGATGTQASFLGLLDGDGDRVDQLERSVAERLGWPAARRTLDVPTPDCSRDSRWSPPPRTSAATIFACSPISAKWRSRSRSTRSARVPWPTSETRCGAKERPDSLDS
jgi:adenylosuccinate lyase